MLCPQTCITFEMFYSVLYFMEKTVCFLNQQVFGLYPNVIPMSTKPLAHENIWVGFLLHNFLFPFFLSFIFLG